MLKIHLDTNKQKVAAMDDSRYSRVDSLIKRGLSWKDFVDNICKKHAKVNIVLTVTRHDNMNWTLRCTSTLNALCTSREFCISKNLKNLRKPFRIIFVKSNPSINLPGPDSECFL